MRLLLNGRLKETRAAYLTVRSSCPAVVAAALHEISPCTLCQKHQCTPQVRLWQVVGSWWAGHTGVGRHIVDAARTVWCLELHWQRGQMGNSSDYPPVLRGHIRALDGLRGVAVLLVLGLHFNIISKPEAALDRLLHAGAQIGWIGVDLFFVLSGFLITGILYRSKGQPGYFRNFYARRSLRIFPLYFAALIVAFLVLPALLPSSEILTGLRTDQWWYWAYLSNVLVAIEGFPVSLTMGHFWSLAIEEQFYLVWPLVVFLLPRRHLLAASASLIGLALVCRTLLVWLGFSTATYVLTPSRVDGLALGALLAVLAHQPNGLQRLSQLVRPVLIATTALLAAIVVWRGGLSTGDAVVQTVGFSLLSFFFGALLIAAVQARGGSPLHWTLTTRPLLFFGKYSYGIYVVHVPISGLLKRHVVAPGHLDFASPSVMQMLFTAAAASLSVAAALLSWNVLEKRFLKLKDRFEAPQTAMEPVPEIDLPVTGSVRLAG